MSNLNLYSTRDVSRLAERLRLLGLAGVARERRAELAACTVDLIHALQNLKDAGIPAAVLFDAAAPLRDAISDLDHAACRDIDEAGEWHDAADLSELDAFIEEVRRER